MPLACTDRLACIIHLLGKRANAAAALSIIKSTARRTIRPEQELTDTTLAPIRIGQPRSRAQTTVFAIILAVSLGHMINDIMQSLLAAIYPMLKTDFHLDFWQIGLLTMAFQVTASLLQPLIGMYTDKRPLPYSLPVGMASSLVGLVVLGFAPNYALLVDRRDADRLRLGDLPPGILARGAARVGRPLRPGAIGVPARRQFRPGDRPAARRLHRRAVRADQRLLVHAGGGWSASSCCGRSAAGTARICASARTRKPLGLAVSGTCRSARW